MPALTSRFKQHKIRVFFLLKHTFKERSPVSIVKIIVITIAVILSILFFGRFIF